MARRRDIPILKKPQDRLGNRRYCATIVRRMLLAGADRAELMTLAKALASLDQRAWDAEVVDIADSAERCRESWPDVVTVHCAGVPLSSLRDALRWFRSAARLPVIVLTRPDQVDHRLLALGALADDDAILPIDPLELRTRAERLVHRREAARRQALGDVVLDAASNEVIRRGDRVRLTPAEFRLLARLCATPNTPVALDDLAAELGDGASRNTVQVHISSLRRKLDATGPVLIHTAHRRGYTFRPTPAVDLEQRLVLLLRREELVKAREEAVARRTELLKRLESRRPPAPRR
jgi:two-component system OmpR family response regulator